MTPGHCPETSGTDLLTSPLFNSLTSGLTISPSIQFQYHSHPAPVYPSCSVSNTGATQKNDPWGVQDQLSASVLSPSVHSFAPNHALSGPSLVNMSMFTIYLCYVFSKHAPHCNTHTYKISFCALRKSTVFCSITSLKLGEKKVGFIRIVIYLSLPSCVWLERITVGESRDGVYSQEETGIAPISTLHDPPLPLSDDTLRRLCLHCSAQLRPNVLFV